MLAKLILYSLLTQFNLHPQRRMRELNEIAGIAGRGMDEYETPVLFPLPQSFIDANTGNPLENNPGY